MKAPKIKIRRIAYFPIVRHWRRLKPLFESDEAERLWRANLRDYSEQKAAQHKFKYEHNPARYRYPRDHDGCDWRCCRVGRHPEFWNYCCHAACHWLVDMNLHVAMSAYPDVPWCILTQRHHSTIWNGDTERPVLFDLNFLALEVPAKQAWEIASAGRMLKPHKPLRPYALEVGYFSA